jgi:hypothetical protein
VKGLQVTPGDGRQTRPGPSGWRLGLECGHTAACSGNPASGYLSCLGSGCHASRRVVAALYLGASCKNCGQDIPLGDAHGPHCDLCLPCRAARIPARCPYKAGDRVQVHSYPGNPRMGVSPASGFRGVVEGYLGDTILTGITDEGQPWAEHWGALDRDGMPPADRWMWCTCCPRPAVQGALW